MQLRLVGSVWDIVFLIPMIAALSVVAFNALSVTFGLFWVCWFCATVYPAAALCMPCVLDLPGDPSWCVHGKILDIAECLCHREQEDRFGRENIQRDCI